MKRLTNWFHVGLISLLLSVPLAACANIHHQADGSAAGENQSRHRQGGTPVDQDDSAKRDPLARAYAGAFKGKKVTLLGPFSGPEEMKFENSMMDFTGKTGITIQVQSTGPGHFAAEISKRLKDGRTPDMADFTSPGLLRSFVQKGRVVDVSKFLDADDLAHNYSSRWLNWARMKGPEGAITAGVWNRSYVKSLVWYPKNEFDSAGYKIPKTWNDMMKLSRQIISNGGTPWCIGIKSGTAAGWPATDWVEDIMLRTTSLENYDKWVAGKLPFTSGIVKNAVRKMSEIWFADKFVNGGRKSIVTTGYGEAVKPMFNHPPKCWLYRQANFIENDFPKWAKPGVDYDWFYFPPIDSNYGNPVLVSGDIISMFHDRPEVRALEEYFTRGESIKSWMQSGGVTAPMQNVQDAWYSNSVNSRIADLVHNATVIRYDGSDVMPGPVGMGTFWKGMTDYVAGKAGLDGAMKEIQAGWSKTRREAQ